MFESTKLIEISKLWDWVTWRRKWKQKGDSWKIPFFKFNWKAIKTNSYKLKSLTRFCVIRPAEAIEIHHYQVYGVQQQKKTKTGKTKLSRKLCEITVSQLKNQKIFSKNGWKIHIRLFSTLCNLHSFFIWTGRNMIIWKWNKMDS